MPEISGFVLSNLHKQKSKYSLKMMENQFYLCTFYMYIDLKGSFV
ncbi:MAG: hypothetical protein RHS_1884 [Robinsoniella sp. RHS]|nr:MAG: hypothetical protein RHS_1884 [Robinsoniella sp. RHS]